MNPNEPISSVYTTKTSTYYALTVQKNSCCYMWTNQEKRVAPQSALIPCVFFCPLCQGKIYYFCPTTDEQSVQNTWTGIALSPSYKCHVVKFFSDKHTDNLKWIRSRIWRTYFSDGQLMPPWYGCCPRWGDFFCANFIHPLECINYKRNHKWAFTQNLSL